MVSSLPTDDRRCVLGNRDICFKLLCRMWEISLNASSTKDDSVAGVSQKRRTNTFYATTSCRYVCVAAIVGGGRGIRTRYGRGKGDGILIKRGERICVVARSTAFPSISYTITSLHAGWNRDGHTHTHTHTRLGDVAWFETRDERQGAVCWFSRERIVGRWWVVFRSGRFMNLKALLKTREEVMDDRI